MEKSDPFVPLVFDTALVPPAARFQAWRSALSSLGVTQRGADPFNGDARLWMLESLVLTQVTQSGNNNTSFIAQTGTQSNWAYVTQSTNGNTSSVTQNGAGLLTVVRQ